MYILFIYLYFQFSKQFFFFFIYILSEGILLGFFWNYLMSSKLISSSLCFWILWLSTGEEIFFFCFRSLLTSYPPSMSLSDIFVCSFSDESSQLVLISILEIVPVKNFVHHLVTKVLSYCLRTSQKISNPTSSVSGTVALQFRVWVH